MARRRRYNGHRPMLTRKHKDWITGAVMFAVALQIGLWEQAKKVVGLS